MRTLVQEGSAVWGAVLRKVVITILKLLHVLVWFCINMWQSTVRKALDLTFGALLVVILTVLIYFANSQLTDINGMEYAVAIATMMLALMAYMSFTTASSDARRARRVELIRDEIEELIVLILSVKALFSNGDIPGHGWVGTLKSKSYLSGSELRSRIIDYISTYEAWKVENAASKGTAASQVQIEPIREQLVKDDETHMIEANRLKNSLISSGIELVKMAEEENERLYKELQRLTS